MDANGGGRAGERAEVWWRVVLGGWYLDGYQKLLENFNDHTEF